MLRVVDANVVISAVLNRGNSLNVFIHNSEKKKFDFIAPQFLINEVGKHTKKIAEKTNLPFEDAVEMLEFVIDQISFIQDEEFIDKMAEVRGILKEHGKDAHYLALALKKNCKIFSGDKVLKSIVPEMVVTPKELLEGFDEDEEK
jgi:predicted nucleic acid-binding protein